MGVNTDSYFGLCPICKTNDGFLNLGRNHWFICHEHKKRWSGGANIFSSWRIENEKIWLENYEKIHDYEDISEVLRAEEFRKIIEQEAQKDVLYTWNNINFSEPTTFMD